MEELGGYVKKVVGYMSVKFRGEDKVRDIMWVLLVYSQQCKFLELMSLFRDLEKKEYKIKDGIWEYGYLWEVYIRGDLGRLRRYSQRCKR